MILHPYHSHRNESGFWTSLNLGNSFHNLQICVSFGGRLRPEALRQAIESVVSRHETLRTVYAASDGEPLQTVRSGEAFSLPILDLGDISKAELERQVLEILDREVNRPFDLSRDLMLRARLLRLDVSKHILALVTHHIASDGSSAGILTREISHAYTSFCQREKSALAELPIQYRDFAIWQRERLGEWRSTARKAAWLLGKATARYLSTPASHRPRSAGGSELSRRNGIGSILKNPLGRAGGFESPRRGYAFHDPAGGLSIAAMPLQRARGHRHRVSNRRKSST